MSEEMFIQTHIEIDTPAIEGQATSSTEDCNSRFGNDKTTNFMKRKLCDECGKSFSTGRSLVAHVKAHKFSGHKSLLKCDICDELFPTKASLARHRRMHQKQFRCEECGKCFGKKTNLDGHKLVHDGREPYKCDTCGEEFAYNSLLTYHMRDHTGEKSFKCNVCGESFKLKGILKNHMTIHSNERNFKCVICSKTFRYSRHLVAHIKTHTKLMPVSCEICHASFSSKKTLKCHMDRHLGKTLYKCKFCLQGFDTKCIFLKHTKHHIAENQWKCLDCGEIFSSKTLLTRHKRNTKRSCETESESCCFCNLCGQNFTKMKNLKNHRRMHIAKDRWKCLTCAEVFSSQSLLFTHRRKSHRGKSSHKCEFCERAFTRNGNLNTHKKLHVGLNKWKCRICEQIFSNFDLLQLHRKENHYRMEKNSLFKCDFCEKDFTTKVKLEQHNRVHIANNSWKCLACSCILPDSASLKTHRSSCTEVYPKCSFCDATFTNSQSLYYHKKIHTADNIWRCLGCHELFPDRLPYITHGQNCQKLKNVSLENNWCRFCEKSFDKSSNFKYHDKIHVAVNSWKCLTCEKLFSDKNCMKNHKQKSHTNKAISGKHKGSKLPDTSIEKSLKGNICDEGFTTKDSFKRKIHNKFQVASDIQKDSTLLKSSKEIQIQEQDADNLKAILKDQGSRDKSNQNRKGNQCCKKCGFKVAKGYEMSSHRLLHHVKGKLDYICVQCGKCFSNKRALKLHSASYKCKKALNLKCTKCHLAFRNKLDLIHHKETHNNSLHYRCKNTRKKLLHETLVNKSKGKSPFKCQVCLAEFSCKTFLIYHSKMHNNKYRCDLCNAIFKSIYALAAHKKKHKVKKQMKCAYCFKLFKHKVCYKAHMKGHYKIKKKHVCKLCNARFESVHELKKHMGINKFACKFCHKTFHVKGSLLGHKIAHITESKWKCKECEKTFKDERTLIIHSNINHGILGKRKMNACQNECTINCKLKYHKNQIPNKNHIEIKIDDSKAACCLGCGIGFNFMISLQIHNRRWHSSYSCYQCQLEFTGFTSYKNHMMTHTFGCGICKTSIKKYCDLEKHIEVHEVYHKCTFCGEMFDEIGHYRRHILAHGECNVICEYCSDKFQSIVELERHFCDTHASIYRVQNLYYCENCGESFNTSPELQIHSKTHQNSKKCRHFKTEFSSYKEWKDTVRLFANKKKFIFCGSCKERIDIEAAADYCFLTEKSLRPHVCVKCNKYFLQKRKVTEHLSAHGEFNNATQTLVSYTYQPSREWLMAGIGQENLMHESPINITKEITKLKPPQKHKDTSTKQRHCSISTRRKGFHLNESKTQADTVQKLAAVTESNDEISLPQRIQDRSAQLRYRSVSTVSKSNNVNKAALITNLFQSATVNSNDGDLNVPGNNAGIDIKSECIADELFRKNDNFQSSVVNSSETCSNEYTDAQVSYIDNFSESKPDRPFSSELITIKSEDDVDTYFNIDSSSSPNLNHTNNHTNELIKIKNEPIEAFGIEDINPELPNYTEIVGVSNDVKQKVFTPITEMTNDGKYTEQKCESGMLKSSENNMEKDSCKSLYMCDICHGLFPNRLSEWIHKRIHESNTSHFKCELCCASFRTMDGMVRHQSKHRNAKSHSFFCCFCDENFSDEDVCKYHIKFRLCLVN